MVSSVNREFLEQTSFDSATPVAAAAVAHRFERDGDYILSLARGDDVIETRAVSVFRAPADPSATGPGARPATSAHRGLDSIEIDIGEGSQLKRPALAPSASPLEVKAGGYVLFTAPQGRAHRAVVRRASTAGEPGEMEFDTVRLSGGDTFAVTITRPGRYLMKNNVKDHKGTIVVSYPVLGDKPYRPAEPATVECTEAAFSPGSVTLSPGQGVIFLIRTAADITVRLEEPDDGPGDFAAVRPRAALRRRPV